ncbi:hypothetical protein IFU39_16280 [Paenibacillus sp. CFBP 13594]|uniref:hypothetical protein n=1 Tax=Paenibacillus sp. CFBP 13594 TaxID=2774037 RepID=UPI001780475E|nr:hypothetical protein [Paenibacillus sp. CFBP 13594]MBD8839370.1 hypothetical protein [Paenibacillus sp. CFBP 13594]
MNIDIKELKDRLYGWYYEGYERGVDSFLSLEEARALYDCMVIIQKAIDSEQEFIIDGENRP